MKKILIILGLLLLIGCEHKKVPTVIVKEDGIYYGYYDNTFWLSAWKQPIPVELIDKIKELEE